MNLIPPLIVCAVAGILAGCQTVDTPKAATCTPSTITAQLQHIEQHIGQVKIISAHRPGARVAGTRRISYHASCRAVDFTVAGKGAQQRALHHLQSSWNGGIGTYSGGKHHIHIDDGSARHWHTHVRTRKAKRHG